MGCRNPQLPLIILVLATAFSRGVPSSRLPYKASAGQILIDMIPTFAVFPVFINSYPDRAYYVSMDIGGKPYYLKMDTGSDLTWLACDVPGAKSTPGAHPLYKPLSNSLAVCNDPLCTALRSSFNNHPSCNSSNRCDYNMHYADNLTSSGFLITDAFSITLATRKQVQPQLGFGCGYNQYGQSESSKIVDGILGLGNGNVSIISQLSAHGVTTNVVGQCLSRGGGGYVFFGDAFIFTGTWVPMSTALRHQYSPGSGNVFFGKQPLGINNMPVVFDSGDYYTYFDSKLYEAFLSMLRKDLQKKPLKDPHTYERLPVCWKGPKFFKSIYDVKQYFTTNLIFTFANGTVPFEIPPENYLIVTEQGNVCLGILDGSNRDLDNINVIGGISFQDVTVVYDNERKQIGWFEDNCDDPPTI